LIFDRINIINRWINADRQFLTWRNRLRAARQQWVQKDYDEGALLRGALLAEAEHWLEQRRDDISQDDQNFIETGLQLRDRERVEREARRQRKLEAARKLAEEQRKRAEEQAKAAKKLRRSLVVSIEQTEGIEHG